MIFFCFSSFTSQMLKPFHYINIDENESPFDCLKERIPIVQRSSANSQKCHKLDCSCKSFSCIRSESNLRPLWMLNY